MHSPVTEYKSYADLSQRVNDLENMIAQHQHTEAKILQNGNDFHKLAEMLPEAVFETDLGAHIIYLNRNGKRQFGYKKKTPNRKISAFDLIIPEDRPEARQHFSDLISNQPGENDDTTAGQCQSYTAVKQDGGTFPSLFLCTLVTHDKKVVGVRGFVRDVSTCRYARQALVVGREQLEKNALRLEEANLALNVLLKQHEKNKNDLADDVLGNVETIILPHLHRLKTSGLTPHQGKMIELLENDLRTMVSPFARTLSSRFYRLTPTEVRIANLIKQGKTTKEIALLLGVAISTIDTHRNHIREKLKLKSRRINLRTFLKTLQ